MNIVTATFSAGCTQIDADRKLWQYDQGQVLQLVGLDLPDAYQVEFSNSRDKGSAKAQIGGPDGVSIPDEYLTTGKPVYAFLVGHTAEEDRETEKLVVIYVNARSQPTDEPITPEQQSIVDQLIAALTAGVAKAEDAAAQAEAAISYMPKIVDGTWWVYVAETETWADTGIQAEGQDGVGISGAVLNADYTLTLTFTDGTSYTTPSIRGPKGEDAPTDYILVQPTEPTSPTNRLWVDSDRGSTVQLPTMADHQALAEDVAANTQELANQKSAIEGKQDAPADAGTAGQVLGLDDDLNPVWLDQTGGGGGGTTNYNNLTNKPRINGVLLTGDKSAADLGLAAASDIPSVPVQSVNGEIGAVVLDASDVGAVAEPQTAGTAGQVLGLDSNLNPVWVNQSGGGGTANYNDLSNKPQIEGVTLSGNKTASDLGLALASDIPTIPVQSVNGKTGAVVLTASDVGAKPSSYEAPVSSVNSKTGAVVLSASDVGALPDSTAIPSKTSDLTNDSGFVNAAGAAAAAPVQSVNGSVGAVTVQPTITASGILKGNGSGGVSAAVAGTDYLTPATSFSPVYNITAAVYNISATDIGATISPTYAMRNTPMTVNLTQAVSTTLPKGCEIAILNDFNSTVTLATNGVRIATPGNVASGVAGYSTTDAHTFKAAEPFNMIALKKMGNDPNGDTWLLTGNVEVVS